MTTLNDDQPTTTTEAQDSASVAIAPTQPTPEVPVDSTPAPEAEVASAPEPVVDAAPAPEAVVEPTPAPEPAVAPTPAPVAETPASPAPVAKAQPVTSDEDLFQAYLADLEVDAAGENHRKLNKGDRIEATVIQVEKDRVFVDLGTKSEGVVPLAELSEANLDTAIGAINVGDKINVIVIRPEGGPEGNPIVSKKKADFEEVWYNIIDAFEKGTTMTAHVVDRVKGGLVADIGVRGFVPATHVGNGKLRNIDKYVGTTMELKIIELDRERKKVVLSNRQAEDEKREGVKDELFNSVNAGDVLEGTVRRLADYGAFVDLGGIDGLLHISEMSWMRINHPKEVLKEGQKIKVMVLKLDSGNAKISLGLRQVMPDPWNLIKENYKIGQRITCNVNRLVQSGAFIKLPEEAEAFLPVSEISTRRINKPADVLTEGQEVEVVVIDLRPDERRMVLSLRAAGTAIEPPADYVATSEYGGERRPLGSAPIAHSGPPGGKGRKGGGGKGRRPDGGDMDMPGATGRQPTGGATIGERLGALKGLFNKAESEEKKED
ncbi:MAG: 30S ribosomal protein S1 [Armatimonadetes bacterium]|nr:30S ribosomal protein S1 [Armatimonadota bacterium]